MTTTAKLTNQDFASRVGITDSYASYLKNGQRLPSGDVLVKIIQEFELDAYAAMDAYREGGAVFGAFLRRAVFGDRAHTEHTATTSEESGQS